jgi:sulfur carrier protein ThiS adenylyltransferase
MAIDLQDRDLRQRDLVPPDKLADCRALVIGVGAIGRQVALQLAAMGVRDVTLIDFDSVDLVNLAPQGYAPDDLGKLKVEATANWCRRLNPDLKVYTFNERFRRSSSKTLSCCQPDGGRRLVAFCCVDSIAARGVCWDGLRHLSSFFCDARMSAEVLRVLASDRPALDQHYSSTFFSQGEAHTGTCTAKSTIYGASIAAGLMIGQFARWLRGMAVERDLILNLLASELTLG